MLLAVLSGFIVACVVPIIFKIRKKLAGAILSLLPFSLFIYYLQFIPQVLAGEKISENFSWIPFLGINLNFLIDGLNLTFALIISGIGFVVYLYASSYLSKSDKIVPFYIYISIFMASMLGVVTCDNVLALFVFWELTSISSFLLIGFNHEQERSRYAALQSLLVTAGGGLALLAGMIILHQITGTFEISQMAQFNDSLINSPFYSAILILFLIGTFTKSAQFPFHFWLPNAMEAPTPVSAYLHSATMVKAGVFLMIKFLPILGGTDLWTWLLGGFGGWTMIMASAMALKQTDLKRLLAYSTVSVLGTLTMLIGLGGELAISAMIVYLLAHSLYKGALFLMAGIIDHETGTRDIRQIAGLRKYLPITTLIGIGAALSGMGIIPFLGFIGKEMLYDAALQSGSLSGLFITISVIAAINTFAVMTFAGIVPFIGESKYPQEKPHEAPWQMTYGPLVLVILGLLFGIAPNLTIAGLTNKAVQSVLPNAMHHLGLFHGLNTPLLLSLLTIATGLGIIIKRLSFVEFISKIRVPEFFFPSKWYDYIFNGTLSFAELQTKILQNGHLRYYILTILAFFILFVGGAFLGFNSASSIANAFAISIERSIAGVDIYDISILITILIASIFALLAKGRLSAIASMGIIGALISIIYIIYGAPDLAMTQLSIETLSVILFVLVLYKLPRFATYSKLKTRARDLTVAIAFGSIFTLIIIFVSAYGKMDTSLSEYFAQTSYLIGHGKNIVNVILVDFRGFDTMGEITVLAIAGVGVYSLLRLKKQGEEI